MTMNPTIKTLNQANQKLTFYAMAMAVLIDLFEYYLLEILVTDHIVMPLFIHAEYFVQLLQ